MVDCQINLAIRLYPLDKSQGLYASRKVKTPSNGIVVELEDILVETCDAQLIILETI